MFRFWEYYTTLYFMPAFIMAAFPTMKVQFGIANGLVYTLCGLTCNFGMAVLSDKLEKRNLMAKSWVCTFGSLIAIPAMFACCMCTGMGFYFAMAGLGLKFLFSEGYLAPSIAMM